MNSKPEIRRIFIAAAVKGTQNRKAHFEHDQSQTGKTVQQSDHDFAKFILDSAGKMDSIEDMVAFEQTLQRIDLMRAATGQDKASISASQKSYEQFSKTIAQMRKTPDAYFNLNMGHKDTGGDPKKIVKGNSLDFITGNITRMQNRASFAPDSEREIWNARINVAKKTGDMFRALHNSLAENFERKQMQKTAQQEKPKEQEKTKSKAKGMER